MAVPPSAQSFAGSLDPHEELDFLLDCGPLLESGEEIVGYTLTVLAEGVALGLTIMSGSGRDHELVGNNRAVRFWATIDAAYKSNAGFAGSGTSLPLEIALVTNSDPARIRNRTFLIEVAQL